MNEPTSGQKLMKHWKEIRPLLEKVSDKELSQRFGISIFTIGETRRKLGIKTKAVFRGCDPDDCEHCPYPDCMASVAYISMHSKDSAEDYLP